ncbi:MAG: hypothetical protein H6994_11765 [Pseudomonadales bacterium]|nr:hypothetical protein [Pseudomonadales bacterium]
MKDNTLSRSPGRRIFRRVLVSGLLLTMCSALPASASVTVGGVGASSAAAAKSKPRAKGNLTQQQKAAFKASKTSIKSRERAAIRSVNQWRPAVARAERTQKRRQSERDFSARRLDSLKSKLDKARVDVAKATTAAQAWGVQDRLPAVNTNLNRLETLYAKAQAAHLNGPEARLRQANGQLTTARNQLVAAARTRDAARRDLVVRKGEKNALRRENLDRAQLAKIQKQATRNNARAPMTIGAPTGFQRMQLTNVNGQLVPVAAPQAPALPPPPPPASPPPPEPAAAGAGNQRAPVGGIYGPITAILPISQYGPAPPPDPR